VLRCEFSDGGPDTETTVIIDENELSLDEFGKLISTHNGWGSEYGNRFGRKVRMKSILAKNGQ